MRSNTPLLHGDITASIIDSFFEVHKELGFGFREYIYSRALERLLIAKGHKVEREVAVMVYFRGEPLAYERMDMLVDGAGVIETKAGPQKTRASIASSSKIGSSNEPAVPVVAVAVPLQSTVQLPFPKKDASMMGDGGRISDHEMSAGEIDMQIAVAAALRFIGVDEVASLSPQLDRLSKMLFGLYRRLSE